MKPTREQIMKWLEAKHTRTVYSASFEFNLSTQEIWDILNGKDK